MPVLQSIRQSFVDTLMFHWFPVHRYYHGLEMIETGDVRRSVKKGTPEGSYVWTTRSALLKSKATTSINI